MDFRKLTSTGKKYIQYQSQNHSRTDAYNFFDRVISEGHLVIEIRKYFAVVENMFKYDIWDGNEVEDHLLVVPKRFVESVSEFSEEEREEYWQILADYESKGYAFYARAPLSKRKSVRHQHTHLILPNFSKRVNFIINLAGKFLWWSNK